MPTPRNAPRKVHWHVSKCAAVEGLPTTDRIERVTCSNCKALLIGQMRLQRDGTPWPVRLYAKERDEGFTMIRRAAHQLREARVSAEEVRRVLDAALHGWDLMEQRRNGARP